jgi:hypothetical protein
VKPIIQTVFDVFVLKSFRKRRKQNEYRTKNIQIISVEGVSSVDFDHWLWKLRSTHVNMFVQELSATSYEFSIFCYMFVQVCTIFCTGF